MTEEEIHKALVDQLRQRGNPDAVWFHVPNASKSTPGYRRKLASLGLRPGTADLIGLVNGEAFALELKADKGKTQLNQIEFISNWNAAGGFGFIAHGLDEAIRVCEAWGWLRGRAI
jgi:hypothetical protein